MENKLAIIDGSSLLYRAFYALPPTMTSPDGVPTNAVYGFLRMLLSLYRELDPAYVAVTFDKRVQSDKKAGSGRARSAVRSHP